MPDEPSSDAKYTPEIMLRIHLRDFMVAFCCEKKYVQINKKAGGRIKKMSALKYPHFLVSNAVNG